MLQSSDWPLSNEGLLHPALAAVGPSSSDWDE